MRAGWTTLELQCARRRYLGVEFAPAMNFDPLCDGFCLALGTTRSRHVSGSSERRRGLPEVPTAVNLKPLDLLLGWDPASASNCNCCACSANPSYAYAGRICALFPSAPSAPRFSLTPLPARAGLVPDRTCTHRCTSKICSPAL